MKTSSYFGPLPMMALLAVSVAISCCTATCQTTGRSYMMDGNWQANTNTIIKLNQAMKSNRHEAKLLETKIDAAKKGGTSPAAADVNRLSVLNTNYTNQVTALAKVRASQEGIVAKYNLRDFNTKPKPVEPKP